MFVKKKRYEIFYMQDGSVTVRDSPQPTLAHPSPLHPTPLHPLPGRPQAGPGRGQGHAVGRLHLFLYGNISRLEMGCWTLLLFFISLSLSLCMHICICVHRYIHMERERRVVRPTSPTQSFSCFSAPSLSMTLGAKVFWTTRRCFFC